LELSDIIAPQHRGSAIEKAIAQPPARLDQGRPRLWTTDTVDPETPPVLEGFYCGLGAIPELALGVESASQPERVQPSLDVTNRRT
jgi:hypothetical protein